ncbi:MAG TPA: protein translocase subunit SecF [Frankiaceae bacterium]|nr:protein translocase subunit SecF [Frankiaceae bacterium]
MSVFSKLYQGETNVDFIGRRRTWYAVSAVLLMISIGGFIVRGGFNLGVDFTGGAVFEFEPAAATTVVDVRETIEGVVESDPIVEKIGSGVGSYRVKTKALTGAQVDEVAAAISREYGVAQDSINPTSVSPTWGQQITQKALLGLVVFLALVILYISMRFEPKMAVASIAALFHDIIITAGIYALVGFEVTPSTVIAFLTILGYSLYDNIVVFDKVRENTVGLAGSNRMTYSDAANLSINQTIMRSINTTLTSLLPVASLLFVGVFLLGAGSLKDLSLSLFVGMAAGAYSSVFFATPLLVEMKEREPQFKALASRIAARGASGAGRTPAVATAGARGGTVSASASSVAAAAATADAAEEAPARPAKATGAPNRPQPRPAKRKPHKGGRPHGKKRR